MDPLPPGAPYFAGFTLCCVSIILVSLLLREDRSKLNCLAEEHVFLGVGIVVVSLVEEVKLFLQFWAWCGAQFLNLGRKVVERQVLLNDSLLKESHYFILHSLLFILHLFVLFRL
jgi:hypothetical protein